MSGTAQVTREYADTQTQEYRIAPGGQSGHVLYADTETKGYPIERGRQYGHVPDCPGN